MRNRPRHRLLLTAVVALAAITFLSGLNWGLPSRQSDPLLFGDRQPWTGAQIMRLAGAWEEDGTRGADIAMHPVPGNRPVPILLNDTDAKRAEIVRRYRLYSNQPDEMITFRSLSRMKPGRFDLDPRLYQYGGLWIYPVGALLKLASVAHLITLRTDLAFYLDHPDAFARFYLVARGYSAAWGLMGVLAVFAIAREWTGKFSVGLTAAAVYASLPLVIDLSHEAKPHLAGAVLTLLAIGSAMRYTRTGLTRWWIAAGIAAGAAMGMVLTGYAAFAVLPVMTLLRPTSWKTRFKITAASVLIGIAIFALTNPYLPLNLLFHRQVLHSNVGNYGTFYQPRLSWSGLVFSAGAVVEGTSIGPALVGLPGIVAFCVPLAMRRKTDGRGLLLAAPAMLVLIQFVLLAEGKTAEYARFALLPDLAIAITAAALVDRLRINGREKMLASVLLIAATLYFGLRYDLNFLADNQLSSTRRTTAALLHEVRPDGGMIAVWAEPAPYCLPPVDLFRWRIYLMPRGSTAGNAVYAVTPVDRPTAAKSDKKLLTLVSEPPRLLSPISWANKPFEVWR